MNRSVLTRLVVLALLVGPLPALADPAPVANSGDTAWMLTASLLVLMMSLPGLALFYGGLVRSKNVLSVLMQCFAIVSLVTVLWVAYGYSVAFSTAGMKAGEFNFASLFGGLDKAFLHGVSRDSLTGTVPESVFAMFQLTFAAITPALIVGADVRLPADRAHDLGRRWRFVLGLGRDRFRGRHGGAHQCRRRRAGGLLDGRQTQGVADPADAAA